MINPIHLNQLIRQTGVYGFFRLLGRAVNFLVIPVYSHFLLPSAFGTLDILYLLVWFLGILGGGKIETAFLRYYHEAREDNNKRNSESRLYITALIGVASLASFFVLLGFLYAPAVLRLMFPASEPPYTGFYLALLVTWLQLVSVIPLANLRAQQKARFVGSLSLVQSAISASVGVFFVAYLNLGFIGILAGLAAGSLFLVVGALIVSPPPLVAPHTEHFRKLVAYSLPMLPAPLFMYFLHYADRYLLLHFGDLSDVGIYGMAYRLAMVLNLLVMAPFGEMWGPNQFRLHRSNQRTTYQRLALLYIGALCFVGLGITSFSYEFVVFALSREYSAVLPLIFPLITGMVVWGVVPTLELGSLVKNKTWIRTIATATAALSNIALNLILIPRYQALGAAYATLFSFVVLTGVTYSLNKNLTSFRPDIRTASMLIGLFAIFSALPYLVFDYLPYALSLFLRIISLGLYLLVITWILDIDLPSLQRALTRRDATIRKSDES
jgi:O-antigen/teichoic acid export membrane protein